MSALSDGVVSYWQGHEKAGHDLLMLSQRGSSDTGLQEAGIRG